MLHGNALLLLFYSIIIQWIIIIICVEITMRCYSYLCAFWYHFCVVCILCRHKQTTVKCALLTHAQTHRNRIYCLLLMLHTYTIYIYTHELYTQSSPQYHHYFVLVLMAVGWITKPIDFCCFCSHFRIATTYDGSIFCATMTKGQKRNAKKRLGIVKLWWWWCGTIPIILYFYSMRMNMRNISQYTHIHLQKYSYIIDIS